MSQNDGGLLAAGRTRFAGRAWLPEAFGAAAVVTFVLALYLPAAGSGLVSDAYFLFGRVSQGIQSILFTRVDYHYYPLGLGLLALQFRLCGLDAVWHSAVTLGLHLVTSLLVARLGRDFGLSRLASWCAAVLFATSSLSFEVPLWAIGTLYSASTCLYVLALRVWIRAGRPRILIFVLLMAAGLLVHEQTASLLFVCLLHAALLGPAAFASMADLASRRWWTEWLRRTRPLLAPAVVVLAAYVGVKWLAGSGRVLLPGLAKGWLHPVGPFAFHATRTLFPSLRAAWAWKILRPGLPVPLTAAWYALLALAMLMAIRPLARRHLFLLSWVLVHVAMMSFAIGLASRHYYLPLVPASLLVLSLIESVAQRLALGLPRLAGAWAPALILAAVLGILCWGLPDLHRKVAVWRQAAGAADRILAGVDAAQARRPQATRLIAVNLPDGIPLGESEPAFVFRFGFEDAVQFRWPGRFVAVERRRTLPLASWVEPFGAPVTPAELAALARDPNLLILCKSPYGETGARP
ncbi:MAG TPA: hypothetical protein VF173_01730 [Thermoanaerobaculia bacterium]|nr:hypothetical protein [Thermoanaerobaculia bacterium]